MHGSPMHGRNSIFCSRLDVGAVVDQYIHHIFVVPKSRTLWTEFSNEQIDIGTDLTAR